VAKFKPLRSGVDSNYVLGGGLEPPRLTAYAPQTYVSAISPPERFEGTQLVSRTTGPASVSSPEELVAGHRSLCGHGIPMHRGRARRRGRGRFQISEFGFKHSCYRARALVPPMTEEPPRS